MIRVEYRFSITSCCADMTSGKDGGIWMTKRKRMQRRTSVVGVEELVRTVADDLSFLRRQDYREIGRTEARIYSGILRRLLYEGALQAAWNALGFAGEPAVDAVDLRRIVDRIPRKFIQFAYAGGANLPQARHCGLVMLRISKEDQEALGGPDAATGACQPRVDQESYRRFALGEFCESPCVIAGEAEISRVEVIRYVANKLGGVHLDGSRGESDEFLGSRHRFLDETHLYVGHFPAPLHEVLSIAQDVSKAVDSTAIIAAAERQFPEPAMDSSVLAVREGRLGRFADFRYQKVEKKAD